MDLGLVWRQLLVRPVAGKKFSVRGLTQHPPNPDSCPCTGSRICPWPLRLGEHQHLYERIGRGTGAAVEFLTKLGGKRSNVPLARSLSISHL